jgi:hypothetical protein
MQQPPLPTPDPLFPASPAMPPQYAPPPPPRGASGAARRPRVWLGAGLLAGGCVGFFAGSLTGAERVRDEYRNPLRSVPPEPKAAKAGGSASGPRPDPRPPAGAKVVGSVELPVAREALRALTAADKVVVTVAAVGRGDEGAELHLSVHNRGDCVVTGVEGIAYGFDPDGRATAMNAGGEHFVAFASKGLRLEPGKTSIENWPLHNIELANVALGQVDRVTCEDGRTFGR